MKLSDPRAKEILCKAFKHAHELEINHHFDSQEIRGFKSSIDNEDSKGGTMRFFQHQPKPEPELRKFVYRALRNARLAIRVRECKQAQIHYPEWKAKWLAGSCRG